MQIKQSELSTPEGQKQYAEMEDIVKRNVCGECGGPLQIHTVPEEGILECGCLDRSHKGYKERLNDTQAFRQGLMVTAPGIQAAIEKKMIPKGELARAINLLAMRYPSVIKDKGTASLFLVDCVRLDLDPLIQPAEAVPVAFTNHQTGKTTISMIITSDGWLSMAARGCTDAWVGPPKTIRLEDYLSSLEEYKGRPYADIQERVRAIKNDDCGDPGAWYYLAIGRRRDGEVCQSPGYFTHGDQKAAANKHLPAGDNPGNQARRRAIKHWVRDVFPECRQRMIELTTEWMRRSEGIQEAQTYIDAEYSIITEPEKKSPPKTSADKAPASNEPPAAAEAEKAAPSPSEGLDWDWLTETLEKIRWSEETTKSYLGATFKVVNTGKLEEVIRRLTPDQLSKFCKYLNDTASRIPAF